MPTFLRDQQQVKKDERAELFDVGCDERCQTMRFADDTRVGSVVYLQQSLSSPTPRVGRLLGKSVDTLSIW